MYRESSLGFAFQCRWSPNDVGRIFICATCIIRTDKYNLQFILEMINRFMQPEEQDEKEVDLKRIGVAKGQKLYDDDYDFDEMNDDIAKMFGVM